MKLRVNGLEHEVSAEPKTPLLYVLRNDLGLKGTRFGCGSGQCGACMVVMDGAAIPSCDTPLWSAEGRDITTAESSELDVLRQAFLDEQAAQCGYIFENKKPNGCANRCRPGPQPLPLRKPRADPQGH
jgi:nicotinate dehydrogenase subunit A